MFCCSKRQDVQSPNCRNMKSHSDGDIGRRKKTIATKSKYGNLDAESELKNIDKYEVDTISSSSFDSRFEDNAELVNTLKSLRKKGLKMGKRPVLVEEAFNGMMYRGVSPQKTKVVSVSGVGCRGGNETLCGETVSRLRPTGYETPGGCVRSISYSNSSSPVTKTTDHSIYNSMRESSGTLTVNRADCPNSIHEMNYAVSVSASFNSSSCSQNMNNSSNIPTNIRNDVMSTNKSKLREFKDLGDSVQFRSQSSGSYRATHQNSANKINLVKSPLEDSLFTAFQSSPVNPHRSEPVYVNVYDLIRKGTNHTLSKIGLGLYHTGVEVYGMEWGYGEAVRPTQYSGIFHVNPRTCMSSLNTSIYVGETDLSPEQVDTILHRLENEWRSVDYHVSHKNCNHFTKYFLKLLSTGQENVMKVPAWVNRVATGIDKIVPQKLSTWLVRKVDGTPPVAVSEPERGFVGELPISVIPEQWYSSPEHIRAPKYVMIDAQGENTIVIGRREKHTQTPISNRGVSVLLKEGPAAVKTKTNTPDSKSLREEVTITHFDPAVIPQYISSPSVHPPLKSDFSERKFGMILKPVETFAAKQDYLSPITSPIRNISTPMRRISKSCDITRSEAIIETEPVSTVATAQLAVVSDDPPPYIPDTNIPVSHLLSVSDDSDSDTSEEYPTTPATSLGVVDEMDLTIAHRLTRPIFPSCKMDIVLSYLPHPEGQCRLDEVVEGAPN